MWYANIINTLFTSILLFPSTSTSTPTSTPSHHDGPNAEIPISTTSSPRNISIPLFISLEEFSRIVDISYCVGTTGIQAPFSCASRCDEFPNFELITEFNTGPLMSDSCGYIALDHGSMGDGKGRIIVAFRGTYSLANTIVDLSTVPQEYVPYPGSHSNDTTSLRTASQRALGWSAWVPRFLRKSSSGEDVVSGAGVQEKVECFNCTVHSGFWQSWQNTRSIVIPHLEAARSQYPSYSLHLVGHSLGGAVAALAGLELDALAWDPTVTTFGEPKIGNAGMRRFLDMRFGLSDENSVTGSTAVEGGVESRYRRVTHVDDPVPLLPLQEWGYKPHAGEVFISKSALQPSLLDLQSCQGDEDDQCSAGSEASDTWLNEAIADALQHATSAIAKDQVANGKEDELLEMELKKRWGIPISSRYKMWQLFFAHRDYFWRLGLCLRGGDPSDWGRDKYRFPGDGESQEENPQKLR